MGGGALLYSDAYREAVEKLALAPAGGEGLKYQAKCVAYNVCRTSTPLSRNQPRPAGDSEKPDSSRWMR